MDKLKTTAIIALFTLLQEPLQVNSDSGLLHGMRAECNNDGIKVHLEFRKPFYGVAYSHGYYETERCRYIGQDSPLAGSTNYSFLIPAKGCGTVHHGTNAFSDKEQGRRSRAPLYQSEGETVEPTAGLSPQSERNQYNQRSSGSGNEIYIENTLLIQHDPSIQEAGDLAQTLRCVWQKEIHRPLVASLPFHTAPRGRIPEAAQTPKYKNRFGSSSVSGSSYSGGTRMEHKGQVESVPHYPNLRRKWSRSLKESSLSTASSNNNKDNNWEDAHHYEPVSLALPLTGNTASTLVNTMSMTTLLLAASSTLLIASQYS